MFSCNVLIIFLLLHAVWGKLLANEIKELCDNLECDETEVNRVCGFKVEGEQSVLKIFNNECNLLKFGCQVDEDKAYGIINMEYCEKTSENHSKTAKNCADCPNDIEPKQTCGIRKDGEGFRIRIFDNECQLRKYNCERNFSFDVTDSYVCYGMKMNVNNKTTPEIGGDDDNARNKAIERDVKNDNDEKFKMKHIFVVDGSVIDRNNINESIDNFFAATHVFDLPMRQIQPYLNESTRKRLLPLAGPVVVYKPWVRIPKNITDDHYHNPTLNSCYHKCPMECPDTYAPVCGHPGTGAREPSLMFKNHCFMDMAQCKVYWEDKSETALSSAYIESSFIFCLGDELNNVYRFLPLIRTLQHMGRLKKKGKFRYKLRNMRFFNNLFSGEPKIMG